MLHEMLGLLIENKVPVTHAIEQAVANANSQGFMVTLSRISNYELQSFLKPIVGDLIQEQKNLEEHIKKH